jgi:hypothetical protein
MNRGVCAIENLQIGVWFCGKYANSASFVRLPEIVSRFHFFMLPSFIAPGKTSLASALSSQTCEQRASETLARE